MKLPRIVRQIAKRVVKATPILRRHMLPSTDYQVLGGMEKARGRQRPRPADGLPAAP